MKLASFYDKATGLFNGVNLTVSDENAIAANTPAGCVAIEGHYHPRKQKVDLATGQVVAYTPPAAAPDPLAVKRAARTAIQKLESSQHRAVREALIGTAGAVDRLKAIEEQIAAYRKDL